MDELLSQITDLIMKKMAEMDTIIQKYKIPTTMSNIGEKLIHLPHTSGRIWLPIA